tara:strand:+ start:89366 stop:89473 length:108 start_codon:yes stop_codon:yes gene_type:complete
LESSGLKKYQTQAEASIIPIGAFFVFAIFIETQKQ